MNYIHYIVGRLIPATIIRMCVTGRDSYKQETYMYCIQVDVDFKHYEKNIYMKKCSGLGN
jgi:hypothetical protein